MNSALAYLSALGATRAAPQPHNAVRLAGCVPGVKLAGLGVAVGLVPLLATKTLAATPIEEALFERRHVLVAGVSEQKLDARISATSPDLPTAQVKLDDLGVDNRDYSYYAEYRYRFRPRWELSAGAYRFSGSGGSANSGTFNYDGVEFTAGAQINASFAVDAYIVDLMYRAYRSERVEVMLGGGLHALDLEAQISGQVQISETESEFREAGSTLLAPVPNLRGAASWAISERFGLKFTGGWLSANVDEYDGAFVYGHLRGIYQITDSLGVSLGYQYTDVDITQTRSRGELAYDLTLNGPTLTLRYGF